LRTPNTSPYLWNGVLSLQKQDPLVDHFHAEVFQSLLQSRLLFGGGVTHTEVLFWFQI
jgi:hypothetical protein